MSSHVRNRSSKMRDDSSVASSNGSDVTTVGMRKTLGLLGGSSYIVGVMIGSGIFVSPVGVLAGAGSVGMSLVLWVLGGVVSLFAALVYAELGTMIPKSSGGYAYLLEAMHPVFAFLFAWVGAVVLQPSGVAIIALTCAEYILVPLFNDGCGAPPILLSKLLTAAVICTLMAVNCMSVRVANRVQIFFTVAKLSALAIIILGGLVKLGQGVPQIVSASWESVRNTFFGGTARDVLFINGNSYTEYLETGFEGTNSNIGEVAIGFYSSMWAYDGWTMLNLMSEEVKDQSKTLPRAILLAIPSVTVLYLLTNISYFTVMSPEDILESPAVAVTWAERVIPEVAWIMPVFVAMSTFGAANGSLCGSSRVLNVAAREKHSLKSFSMIHVNRYTPIPAILITGIIGIFMAIPSNIWDLLNFFSFTTWFFNGLTFGCHIYLRYKQPDAPRPFRCPIVFSVISILISLFLVLAPIIFAPQIQFLYAVLFIVGGLIFYLPFVHFKKELPFMEKLNAGLQTFLQLAPADDKYVQEALAVQLADDNHDRDHKATNETVLPQNMAHDFKTQL